MGVNFFFIADYRMNGPIKSVRVGRHNVKHATENRDWYKNSFRPTLRSDGSKTHGNSMATDGPDANNRHADIVPFNKLHPTYLNKP